MRFTLGDPAGKGTDLLVGTKAPFGAVAIQGRALEPYCKVGSASIDPDLPLRTRASGTTVEEAWSSSRNSPIPRVQARFEAMCLEARPRGSRSVTKRV